jgi:hypothetical protein
MATLGAKPDQPWSTTSVAAGVDSKPQPGSAITRVGEIVDFSCYIQLGKHGEKHRACGQKCVNNGQPIGLLTKDGALYMLMPEEHDPRRDGGVDGMGVAGHALREHPAHHGSGKHGRARYRPWHPVHPLRTQRRDGG